MRPERGRSDDLLGIVDDAALCVSEEGRVLSAGPRAAPADEGHRVVDLRGAVVMPGLVESHTHLVWGGDRLDDFVARPSGVSYADIARRGGGISTTVRATRAASGDDLRSGGRARLDSFLKAGVTTVEIKSGYGLETETELKMLRVIRALDEEHPIDVIPTFLGAHTIPRVFGVTRERYLAELLEEMLPAVAECGLAEFCDVFCEETAFSLAESRQILEAAAGLGLKLKIHAEQLSYTGAARLAAELGAVSADHLEELPASDIRALAEAGTVASLLPGATLFLGQERFPPARALIDGGVTVALSTDCNPGSSPTTHLWLMGTLGCVRMGMSPSESLAAMTVGGARALGRAAQVGALAPGMQADFVVLDSGRPEQALYWMGALPVARVYKRGRLVSGTADEGEAK